jgi:hypothetical protein
MVRRGVEWVAGLMFVAVMIFMPTAVFAQGSITGVVKDATGAVLPGVTVEAASPALIEKTRTTISGEQGEYRLVDLHAGTYSVTFTLPGFSTVVREGVELTGAFTASVNAELRIGGVEETITVSGQSPVVDVQGARQQTVITAATIESIPTARTAQNFAQLVPGVTLAQASSRAPQDVGGESGERQRILYHGSKYNDYSMTIDGLTYNILNNAGSSSMITVDPGSMQEYTLDMGASSADVEKGGVRVALVPKDGGNTFSGAFFGTYNTGALQSDNVTPALAARGAGQGNPLKKQTDFDPSLGGPIKKDRLWFFASWRHQILNTGQPGTYFNATPELFYTPDLSRPAIDLWWIKQLTSRVTWQASRRDKISLSFFNNSQCACPQVRTVSPPDGQQNQTFPKNWQQFIVWNSTLTNKLLLQTGMVVTRFEQDVSPSSESTPFSSILDSSTGVITRSAKIFTVGVHKQQTYRAALTYATGAHNFTTGFMLQQGDRDITTTANGDINLTVVNSVPKQITEYATPYEVNDHLDRDLGIFAQDRWTLARLTLNVGLRFDQIKASVPAQFLPATQFVPARAYQAIANVPNWKDVSPRLSAVYNLLGNSKTAVKFSVNRYVAGELVDFADSNNPVNTSVVSTTRTWNDVNGNLTPDCDLADAALNGECGVIANSNFGKTNPTATTVDTALTTGWRKRGYNWETSVGVQQELRPGVALNASYTRRAFGNFTATDNLAVTPADYDPYCITAPSNPGLPGGGGYQVCGLYDLKPEKVGQNRSLITAQEPYGKQSDVYSGIDLVVNGRLPGSLLLQGGLNYAREEINNCVVVDSPQALLNCDTKPPYQPSFRVFGSHPLPRDVMVSLAFQSNPGPMILADYSASSAQILPSLMRNLSAGAGSTVVVPLIAPGTMYGDRLNQVDARVTKGVHIGRLRIRGNFDLFNLLNANPVLVVNNAYGSKWLQPQYLLPGRLLKLSAQLNF